MKRLVLSLLNKPFPGVLVGRLFGFLRHRRTVLGLTNPLYVSHYLIEQEGGRYLAANDSYLARAGQVVRLDPSAFEPEITYLIRSMVRPGDSVIDVGANVGFHTVAFAKVCGHVYAFEPVAEMAERASINCALNGLDNVTLFRFALGEKTGEMEMNVNVSGGGMEGTSSFLKTVHINRAQEHYQPRKVSVRRLDDVLAEAKPAGRVSFIKIDTEGFEPMVLRGAMETIRKHRPAMIVEAHSKRLKDTGLTFKWYLDTFPNYHTLIVYAATPANPYLRLEPLTEEPPEIAVNLLLLPHQTWLKNPSGT
jgi:FkbM family methyltransferase